MELSHSDITLEWTPPPDGALGHYWHRERVILLHPGMPRRQARSVLCHELRHAEHGDVTTGNRYHDARQEVRADREAARLLITLDDLRQAVAIHGHHLSACAVELRVSDDLLRTRLQYLHPSERAWLNRCAASGV